MGEKTIYGGGVAQAPHPGYVRPATPRETEAIAPSCGEQKRFLGGGNDLQFFTITTAGGNAQADVPITLPNYAKFIAVFSCPNAHLADSLYLHFDKLNKQYSAAGIVPTGFENWLPLSQNVNSLTKVGLYYRFKRYMPPIIYFDIGQEGGAGIYQITFCTGNDLVKLGSMFASVV